MKRNEFFKACAAGVCGCGILGLLDPVAAGAEARDGQTAAASSEIDQLKFQLDGARERFAKLLAIMEEHLDDAARGKVLRQLGRECAQKYAPLFNKYRGDLEGFTAKVKTAWLEKAEFDEKTGILRVVGKPSPCYCPLVKIGRTPAQFCNCTLGWQEAAYSTVLGKPVTAEIEETILRGGTRCSFRIKI
jgi:hypothetical protein